MIKVGVNEPVFIEKAEKNEKGTLAVTFKEAGGETKKKLSLLEQMNESSDASGSSAGATTFLMFPPSREYQNELQAPEKLLSNLMNFKNQLHHILKRFVTSNQIRWDVLKGIGMIKTDEDVLKAVEDETKYSQIYANIVDQFLTMGAQFKITDPAKLSRLLLVRQSKEKHFGRFRDKFLEEQPFLEDVMIPKDKSKLYIKAGTKGATTLFEADADGYVPKFTDYEISKGLDNPIQSATASDDSAPAPEEVAKVEGLFGQQPEAPVDFSAPAVEVTPEPEKSEEAAPSATDLSQFAEPEGE